MSVSLRGNALLKVIVPVILIGIGAIVILSRSGDSDSGTKTPAESDEELTLTQSELKLLGIEGDTPQDTVATLVGMVKSMEEQLVRSQEESQKLREHNERLANQNSNVDGRIREALKRERNQIENDTQRREQDLLSKLENRFDQIMDNYGSVTGANGPSSFQLPIGGGGPSAPGMESLHWVSPMDAQSPQKGNRQAATSQWTFPSRFDDRTSGSGKGLITGAETHERITGEHVTKDKKKAATPVYTVPANATLMGSLGMTALIGRVPVGGTVNDPYPFKIIIGKDNLTANHIEIPEVQAAIVSGTATGDWTLSCVRGYLTSMTFVFEDGTIRTVPDPNSGGNTRNSRGTADPSNSLGYISDPYGIPCVSGVRRSNAAQYIGNQALITAAGAGIASMLIDDESSGVATINTDGSVSTAISGSQAVASILSNGVSDISDWVDKLYGQAFAAVYVEPGKEVAVHIEVPLEIDYQPDGRKVRHDRITQVSNELP